MKPFLPILLPGAVLIFALAALSALSACHKGAKKPTIPTPLYSQWQWVSYSIPPGPNGNELRPAKDSLVLLFMDADSNFNIRINDSLVSAGYYKISADSTDMYLTPAALLYPPDSLRLCTACSLSIVGDTLRLRAPFANPTNYGTFTFAKPRVYAD
ncbi:MAG TPA: hypothetical protein VKQ52_16300 [Puia sp.]|nr:hypothetical protein [Puia sp.]